MTDDAVVRLGQLLTGTEARQLAALFADGQSLGRSLRVIGTSRRAQVRAALEEAGVLPGAEVERSVAVLQAIQGAASRVSAASPVWTAPGYGAGFGDVTTSIRDLVLTARVSVTCSTFNFQRSSGLWDALSTVCAREYVDVRVYLDARAASRPGWRNSPTASEIARQLPGAKVFQTGSFDGHQVTNHAKFVAVDHRLLVVTSANFSRSAEEFNVELGLEVEDTALAETVEAQMRKLEGSVLHRVT